MDSDSVIFLRKKLKELRAKAGLTQEQVAEKAGIDYKNYQDIEGGNRGSDITLTTIEKLAKVYNLSVHEILKPSKK
jgi:transcriptional regulator with XRE-family HTH domain